MTSATGWITVTGVATVVAVWIAAAAMLFPNVRGKNSMLPTGVVFWAIGCSLQAPWLYVIVDRTLGGGNITNLLYRSAVIVALGCLEVMVIRAMSGSRIRLLEAGVWALTLVMVTAQLALYMAADWSVTDPYLGRYAGEPLRELFAAILPICVGLFGVQVLRVAFRGLPGYGEWTTRWGVSLIGVAAAVDLLWVIESLIIGVVRATVAPHALMAGDVDPLWEIAVVTMCVVTAVGVVVAAARPVIVPAGRRVLLIASIPVSDRAMKVNPAYSVHSTRERHQAAFRSRGEFAELALWQRWAELEDNIRLRQFQPRWHERHIIYLMMVATSASFAGSIVPQLLLPTAPEHQPDPARIESTA